MDAEESIVLPVKEDDLWPHGQLLQIIGFRPIGFKGGSVKGADGFIVILTRHELVVRGGRSFGFDEDLIGDYSKHGIDFYKDGDTDYFGHEFVGEFRCGSSEISKVVVGKFGAGTALSIWIRDPEGQETQAVGMVVSTLIPRTIMRVANKAADIGLLKRRWGMGYDWHAWPLYRRELERRFRQAVPTATVIVEGRVLDESTFIKLIR